MLRSMVFLGLFVLGKTQDLLGVNYTFHTVFYRDFDKKKCDNESAWRLVGYESLNIEPLVADRDTGIRAARTSCASSFPIIFLGGTLEFNVFVKVISQEYKIGIEVFDEFDASITSYQYGPKSESFRSEWQTIYLKIDKHTKGYINIRGRSLNKEIVLIDSFRYIPNDVMIDDKEYKQSISYEEEDEVEMIFKYKDLRQDDFEEFDGSGSGEEPDAEPIENNSTFWTPITIFLVSLGAVVVVAIVGVGGYHYGKVRALDNAILEDDIEPPRTITIPRATNTNQNPTRFIRLD